MFCSLRSILYILTILCNFSHFGQVDSLKSIRNGVLFIHKNISAEECTQKHKSDRLQNICMAKSKLSNINQIDLEIDSLQKALRVCDDEKTLWLATCDQQIKNKTIQSMLTRAALLNEQLAFTLILFKQRKLLLEKRLKYLTK